jgi:hypothetical protein
MNAAETPGIPGSGSSPHPRTGIPLPAHGFERLDELSPPETARVPAADVISRAAAVLITALAGLLAASHEYLGEQAAPLRDGLKALQAAFREASSVPDEPGQGPGEKLIG